MNIHKPDRYSLASIIRDGQIDAQALLDLKQTPEEGLRVIRGFREKIEVMLADLDARWIALCEGDLTELSAWKVRMNVIRHKLNAIDREIGTQGSLTFNWESVMSDMGFINAFREVTMETLSYNENRPKIPAA